MNQYLDTIRKGLWDNNTGLVQLLGLCPLLATSTTLINGLGMGLATTLVIAASNATVSTIRGVVRDEVRIPIFVIIIASLVTAVELVMNAWFHQLYKVLGIFIPLIVTNCAIIGRAEAFASRNNIGLSLTDGLANGLGFTAVLVILGGMREVLGHGTLLAGAQTLFGHHAASWQINVVGDGNSGFLLAALPPGAFFGLGLLVAGKNVIDRWLAERAKQREPALSATEPAAG